MRHLFEKSDVRRKDMVITYVREPKTTTVKNGDGTESIIKSYTLELRSDVPDNRIQVGKDVIVTAFATLNADGDGYQRGTFARLVQTIDELGTDAMIGKMVSVEVVNVHFNTPYYWLVTDEKGKVKRHLNPDGQTPSMVSDMSFARLDGDETSFEKMIDRRILRIMAEKAKGGGFIDTVTQGTDKQYYLGSTNITPSTEPDADDLP